MFVSLLVSNMISTVGFTIGPGAEVLSKRLIRVMFFTPTNRSEFAFSSSYHFGHTGLYSFRITGKTPACRSSSVLIFSLFLNTLSFHLLHPADKKSQNTPLPSLPAYETNYTSYQPLPICLCNYCRNRWRRTAHIVQVTNIS